MTSCKSRCFVEKEQISPSGGSVGPVGAKDVTFAILEFAQTIDPGFCGPSSGWMELPLYRIVDNSSIAREQTARRVRNYTAKRRYPVLNAHIVYHLLTQRWKSPQLVCKRKRRGADKFRFV